MEWKNANVLVGVLRETRVLADAAPWTRIGNEHAIEVLGHIVADQRQTVDRIGEMITESGGDVDVGEFPMLFTAFNDISFDYLLDQIIARHEHLIADVEVVGVQDLEDGRRRGTIR